MRFFLVLLVFFLVPVHAQAWPARVVDVSDGDTITVEPQAGGERVKVRLHGVDCPERKQPFGERAKGFVSNVSLYKNVEVIEKDKDRYGRTVAIITFDSGLVLQEMLLHAGLAWVYPRYCKKCSTWKKMQDRAREQKRGLWKDENPVPPWEWRKRKGTR